MQPLWQQSPGSGGVGGTGGGSSAGAGAPLAGWFSVISLLSRAAAGGNLAGVAVVASIMSDTQFWRDPRLPYVESRRAVHSRACYAAHTHDTVSIGAVDSGGSVFTSGALRRRLRPGSLVMVPAHCAHACNPDADAAWSYQMLHLDAGWVAALLRETAPEAPLPAQPCVSDARTAYQRFCELNALLFSAAAPADKEAALVLYVGGRSWLGRPPRQAAPRLAPAGLRRVEALLREARGQALPLVELAALAGMNRYRFIRAFRAATGMTPHAYQLDLRIVQARRLLRDGQSLSRIAQDLGFADQSHFQRAFKQRVAATPGAYRRAGA